MRATRALESSRFRERLLSREPLLGTFLKTPTGHATEIIGSIGMDFVVADAEHAPFDRASLDIVQLAARSANIACLVRVPDVKAILAALDDGAAGVLVPHVSSAEKAREAVGASRYRAGKRGFSNSPRAGQYGGLPMWPHVDAQDAGVAVIAMIEDPDALDCLDQILDTPGLDGVFIGRGDLAVALGAKGINAEEVRAAASAILSAACRAGKPACMMVADAAEAAAFRELGATAFIISSDQGLMRQAALRAVSEFAALNTAHGNMVNA